MKGFFACHERVKYQSGVILLLTNDFIFSAVSGCVT